MNNMAEWRYAIDISQHLPLYGNVVHDRTVSISDPDDLKWMAGLVNRELKKLPEHVLEPLFEEGFDYDDFAGCDNAQDFDAYLGYIYDWGDSNSVWVGPLHGKPEVIA